MFRDEIGDNGGTGSEQHVLGLLMCEGEVLMMLVRVEIEVAVVFEVTSEEEEERLKRSGV